jgi:hypothetical protein
MGLGNSGDAGPAGKAFRRRWAEKSLAIMKRILSVVLTGEKLARGRMLGVSTADRIH